MTPSGADPRGYIGCHLDDGCQARRRRALSADGFAPVPENVLVTVGAVIGSNGATLSTVSGPCTGAEWPCCPMSVRFGAARI